MQSVEDKLQQITLQPIDKMNTLPEIITDETVVISSQAASLNNTFALKQNEDVVSTKNLVTTTPHRNKPPTELRCLTKSITKPTIQRKRLIINNHKTGLASRRVNQENMPLILAASRTLADSTLAKAVIKTRTNNSNNILTSKSGKFTKYKIL